MATSVKFCKPFYDGQGKPLVGATVELRDKNGNVKYTCTELKASGLAGCYSVDVTETGVYYIYVKPNVHSSYQYIDSWSAVLIPASDLTN